MALACGLGGMRLRVKDLDFDRNVIIVREAKGNEYRAVMLPRSLAPAPDLCAANLIASNACS